MALPYLNQLHTKQIEQDGQVLVRIKGEWKGLAPGTEGQVLKMGSDGAPYWDEAYGIGDIRIWKGAEADIPSGWQLCDGTNGTLDLRDRFIVGAGNTYSVGDTGGSATQADHTGHGAHGDHLNHSSHSTTDMAHSHPFTQPSAHGHGQTAAGGTDEVVFSGGSSANHSGGAVQIDAPSAALTHSAHSSHSNNGAISSHGSNLPPYYALCFIERIS